MDSHRLIQVTIIWCEIGNSCVVFAFVCHGCPNMVLRFRGSSPRSLHRLGERELTFARIWSWVFPGGDHNDLGPWSWEVLLYLHSLHSYFWKLSETGEGVKSLMFWALFLNRFMYFTWLGNFIQSWYYLNVVGSIFFWGAGSIKFTARLSDRLNYGENNGRMQCGLWFS